MSILVGLAIGFGIMGTRYALRTTSRNLDARLARGAMPRLYPELDDRALCEVLAPHEARRLLDVPRLMVVPFAGDDPRSARAGRALALLLRRDLMLVRGLSTCGSEDTPDDPIPGPSDVDTRAHRGQWVLGGRVQVDGERITVRPWVVRDDDETLEAEPLTHTHPTGVLRALVEQLALALGGTLDDTSQRGLEHGRVRTLDGLLRLGELLESSVQRSRHGAPAYGDLELEARALDLLVEEPELSVLSDLIGEHRLGDQLALYQRDPYNASLCFSLYCALWRGEGFQRDAFQFVRRALELCPAHGKCNMVAPHAAFDPSRMGHHSELGYRMLPRNSFAASNYAGWLWTHTKDYGRIIEVCRFAIDLSPEDPANYERLMDAYDAMFDFERAIEVGRELLGYLEPELHPRTRYCLEQNPVIKARMERGEHDPAALVKQTLAKLEAKRAARRS